jgi:hypothetical protein
MQAAMVKPPFDMAIELTSVMGKYILHENINASIDALLNKQPLSVPVNRITVDLGEKQEQKEKKQKQLTNFV